MSDRDPNEAPIPEIDVRWTKWGPELCGIPGWAEQDDEGWTIRQVERQAEGAQPREVFPERTEDRWYLSSWGDGLGEGQLGPEEIWPLVQSGEVQISTQGEFESVWSAALESRRSEWEALKSSLRVGERVEGCSRVIWGRLGWVAVDLGRRFLGVVPFADYVDLAERRGQILGVGWRLEAIVEAFDDHYQWIVLRLTDSPAASG